MSSHNLKPGDRVCFQRMGYKHYGIYIDNGKIIHVTGQQEGGLAANSQSRHICSVSGVQDAKCVVRMNNIKDVADGDKYYKDNSRDDSWRPLEVTEIIERAKKYLDQVLPYNLFNSNCECFANWCRYGQFESDQVPEARPGQPALTRVLFCLCVCASMAHLISSLALYLRSLPSRASTVGVSSYIIQTLRSYFAILPDWLFEWGQRISAGIGCAFCFSGLLVAGKHSLYLADVAHLLVWLVASVLTCVPPVAILSWLHPAQGGILLAEGSVLLSLVCCLRSRRPRHFTVPTIHKKQVKKSEMPVKELPPNTGKVCDSPKKIHKICEPPLSPSPSCAKDDGKSHIENVQQNFESLTLGLTKRSASTSSVWSLPAVVTASSIAPDSTSDRVTPTHIQHSQGVLSPSRLGFLSWDSGVKADGRCDITRSSSPWLQEMEKVQVNNTKSSSNNNYSNITTRGGDTETQHLSSAFRSSRYVQSEPKWLPTSRTDQAHSYDDRYTSAGRSPAFSVSSGPCDSQTPDSGHHHLFASRGGSDNCCIGRVGKGSDPQENCPTQDKNSTTAGGLVNDMLIAPQLPGSQSCKPGPRRSQRISMIGKLPKPWPLKKSLSCNIVYGSAELNVPGFLQARDFVVTSQIWRTNNGNSMENSDVRANMLPATRRVNVGCDGFQKTLKNNKDITYNHRHTQDMSHAATEISDDECDEHASLQRISSKARISDKRFTKNDVPWTWLLVGILMGASLTTNVFLVCQRWWSHATESL